MLKIYDHPIDNEVKVIEIYDADEEVEYLKGIISKLSEIPNRLTFPSASKGENDKIVIYLDRRTNSLFANPDETEIMGALVAQLAGLGCEEEITILEKSLFMAKTFGDDNLIEHLQLQPIEYFSIFKPAA